MNHRQIAFLRGVARGCWWGSVAGSAFGTGVILVGAGKWLWALYMALVGIVLWFGRRSR